MKIEVLGCSGGKTNGANLPSFFVDGKFLFDCGSVCSALPLERQLEIEAVFLSHSHFDHICDLPFLVDNFSIAGKKLKIYASDETINLLSVCMFNGKIWPDFTKIPDTKSPSLEFVKVNVGESVLLGEYKIDFFKVFHTKGSIGFIIWKGNNGLAYTADTYKSDGLWNALAKMGVKSVITECSFPKQRKNLSELSKHLSTEDFKEEFRKMKGFDNVFIFHTKPHYRRQIEKELEGLNVKVLKDGDVFEV